MNAEATLELSSSCSKTPALKLFHGESKNDLELSQNISELW